MRRLVPLVLTVGISVAGGVLIGWVLPRKNEPSHSPGSSVVPSPVAVAVMPASNPQFRTPANPEEGKKTVRQLMEFAKGKPSRLRSIAALIPVIDGWTPEQLK